MSTIQTVQGAMNRNTVLAKAEKDAAAPPKEPRFHLKQQALMMKDPENTPYQQAKALGKAKAAAFMKTVMNPAHPSHEVNLHMFKNVCDMDARKLEENMIAEECMAQGAVPYEMQDGGYEQNLVKKYQPQGNVTEHQLAFYDNFKKGLRDKWDSVGYKGDRQFVEDYIEKYGLTPNNSIQALKNIQPKD